MEREKKQQKGRLIVECGLERCERDIEPFELKFIARLTKSIFCSYNIVRYTLCIRLFFPVQFTPSGNQRAKNILQRKERKREREKKNIATGLDVIQTFLQFFFENHFSLYFFRVIKK